MSSKPDMLNRLVALGLFGLIAIAVVMAITLGNPFGQATGLEAFKHSVTVGNVTVQTTESNRGLTELATWADRYATAISARHGLEPVPVMIRLLDDKRAYRTYGKRYIRGFKSTMEGVYDRRTRALYLWRTRESKLKPMLQHEIFHAIAHIRLPKLPLWFEEGIAELAEGYRLEADGTLRLDDVQTGYMRHVAGLINSKSKLHPGQLPSITYQRFYGPQNRTWYGLSYSVALYLERQGRLGQVMQSGSASINRDNYNRFATRPRSWVSGPGPEPVGGSVSGPAGVSYLLTTRR
jgi:hypothetical protein